MMRFFTPTLRLAVFFAALTSALATTVTGVIEDAVGTPVTGRITITWPTFVSPTGEIVWGGDRVLLITSGALSLELYPNVGSTPAGTSYQIEIQGTGVSRGVYSEEYWVVPDSGTPVDVSTVQTSTPPVPTAIISLNQIFTTGASNGDVLTFNGTVPIWTPVVASANVVVRETDLSPSISSINTLEFLSTDFLVTDMTGGVARVSFIGSGFNCAASPTELTISAGAITIPASGCYYVDTEADAASDVLDTINCSAGMRFALTPEDTTRTIVIQDGGAIDSMFTFSLDHLHDEWMGRCYSTNQTIEESRSNAGT